MFRIEDGNYDEYIKWNGLKEKNSSIALDIKNDNTKYLIVFKDDEYYSDVLIFNNEDNLINLNITFGINDFLDILIEYLKKNNYEYIVFKSDETLYNNLENIRNKYEYLSEDKEDIVLSDGRKFELTSLKIDLTK